MTTAHVLFRHWLQGSGIGVSEEFLRFDEIPRSLLTGSHDHGVVIHETRFTFREMGLEQAVDLGEHWETSTGSPIPLGALLARRDLGEDFAREAVHGVRESLDWAWNRTEPITPWIAANAQEIEPQVQRDHIATYVTAYSRDIGARGLEALRVLWKVAGSIAPEVWPSADRLEAALEETSALG
jgi:1,4-dihydroxy-6-naphthoate synthase